ncbi:hypothetical protein AB0F42_13330 [Streptomyces buecherae]|uniref:hypothetical protein n=1 Tax=Streptomyces buecherae TaxID=2763006 RepID=UPI0033C2F4EF
MSASNDQGTEPVQPIAGESAGAVAAGAQQGAAGYNIRGQGIFNRDLGAPNVNASSRVFVSVAEINPADNKPFLGGGRITVHNVVPHDDGSVTIRVEVDAPRELPVRASLFYYNGF